MEFDVIVIGSGFGGAITGCRLAEAGYKVLILERGRRWCSPLHPEPEKKATPYPRQSHDPWFWSHSRPEHHNGWIDLRVFPNMTVAAGAGVGGGSLIYANISCEAPQDTFQRGWPAEITYSELKPYYDRVAKFMNVQKLPGNQWNPRTKLMQSAAQKLGHGDRFGLLDLAVNFDPNRPLNAESPPTDQDTTYAPNAQGVRQGTCAHLGNCDIGCDVYAKNTLDRNYIPWAEKHGAIVKPLHLISNIAPVSGGYRVEFDHLDPELKTRTPGNHTARIVIVAAGSMGSTELLLRCRDESRTLPNISSFLGRHWSSNGDFLTPAIHTGQNIRPTVGPTISSRIDFLDRSQAAQSFWIQDGGFPNLVRNVLQLHGGKVRNLRAKLLVESVQRFLHETDPLRNIMPWFAQGVDATDGVLRLKRPWWFFGRKKLHLDWDITASKPVIDAIVDMHKQLAEATGGIPLVPPTWTLAGDLVTPHPLGGCNLGNTQNEGVVSHRGEVFGYRNLYVADAAIIPEALGVNPSRTIGALAERIAKIIIDEKR